MKKLLLITVIFLPVTLFAQNINGRFSASLYSFERYYSLTSSDSYIRHFETLNLNINKNNFSLKSRLNLEGNISNSLTNDPRVRFYNLYFEARRLFNVLTLKLGRQSLFYSVAGGVFDGVNVNFKHEGYSLTGFYGGNVPAYQKLELTDDWGNDYVLGGRFSTTALTNFHLALTYVDKNFKALDYTTVRLDEDFNPISVEIQKKSNQYKYGSAEVGYDLPNTLSVNTRYDYDFNFNTTSKFQIDSRYEVLSNLGVDVYYNYRAPKIRYNSIFAVFDYANTYEVEGGIDYKVNEALTVLAKFGNVTYEDDESQRLSLGVNTNHGSLNYRKTFGYAGELDAVSLYGAYPFLDGMITPSVGLSFTTYKLSEDAEKNNLTSVLVGTNVRPWSYLSFDLQGQYFNNKIYDNDFRVLFKINYWFNTNLDMI